MPRRHRDPSHAPAITAEELEKLRKRLSFLLTHRRDHFFFTQLVWLAFFCGQAASYDVAQAADKVCQDGRYTEDEIAEMDLHRLQAYLKEIGVLYWRHRPYRTPLPKGVA